MATHRSSQEWAKILLAYENREVNQAEFCRDQGISLASLYYHRRKKVESNDHPNLIELAKPDLFQQPDRLIGPSYPDCQIECHHSTIGHLKVSCSSTKLALIIEQIDSPICERVSTASMESLQTSLSRTQLVATCSYFAIEVAIESNCYCGMVQAYGFAQSAWNKVGFIGRG